MSVLHQMIRSRVHEESETSPDLLISATIGDLFSLFLANCEDKNLSPKTISDYKQKIGAFLKYLENEKITQITKITRAHVSLFQHQLRATNKDVSIAGYHRCLRAFFNYLKSEKYLKQSPMFGMPSPRFEKRIIQPIAADDLRTMIDSIDFRSYLGARNLAIVLMFLDTAMRLKECWSIKLEDIDKNVENVKILGKGRKERVLHLGVKTRHALMRWLIYRKSRAKDDTFLWLSEEGHRLGYFGTEDVIQDVAKLCGIKAAPHKMRHTAAITALRNKASSYEVQLWLGHATPTMTSHYLESLTSEQVAESHKDWSPADKLK